MANLRQIAQKAGAELTRTAIAPAQGRYCFAPHLVELGKQLLEASKIGLSDLPDLRQDVEQFAHKMSAVMDLKENEKAGKQSNFWEALREIQYQLGKFQQTPLPSKQETERILLHIANFAMIATGLIK